jgi:hypothetical protein
MLGDLFDSMRTETAWFIQRLLIRLYFREEGRILFATAHSLAGTPAFRFFITSVTLNLCVNSLSAEQIDVERGRQEANESIMRNAFRAFDVASFPTVTTGVYQQAAVKNLQSGIVLLASTNAPGGTFTVGGVNYQVQGGVNPFQYYDGFTDLGALNINALIGGQSTGVTQFQQRYEGYLSPLTPLSLTTGSGSGRNTDLFVLWRSICRMIGGRDLPLTITMKELENGVWAHVSEGQVAPAVTFSSKAPYTIYSAMFGNQDTAPRKLVAGGTHEIRVSGPAPSQTMIVVRVRMSAVEIMGDTQIRIMN